MNQNLERTNAVPSTPKSTNKNNSKAAMSMIIEEEKSEIQEEFKGNVRQEESK